MLRIVLPGVAQFQAGVWLCFFAFWVLNMLVIWRGIETIKFLEGIGAPFMLGRSDQLGNTGATQLR